VCPDYGHQWFSGKQYRTSVILSNNPKLNAHVDEPIESSGRAFYLSR
jgi:hypothetical protein